MASNAQNNPANFANRPKEEVREIAAKGGRSRGHASENTDDTLRSSDVASFEGGSAGTHNTNPGNFANRPKEEVREIAAKGGRSHGHASETTGDNLRSSDVASEGGSTGTHNTNPGNFANRPKEEVREIAAMGGRASHGSRGTSETATHEGTHNENPGNFANRPKEEVRDAGRKGGLA